MSYKNPSEFVEAIKNIYLKWFILGSSILSYLLGNIAVFFILSSFFVSKYYLTLGSKTLQAIILVTGTLLSFLLIKTSYFIKSASIKKEKNKKEEATELLRIRESINIGKWNAFILFLRLLFFNVLNDLFIVLIIWLAIFGILYSTGVLMPIQAQFMNLVSIVTIIGILSGIFQFYRQSYKEKISQQIIGTVAKQLRKIWGNYSFMDFLDYTEEFNRPISPKIQSKLKENPILPMFRMFKDLRGGKDITHITLNVSAANDSILAQALEFSDINKDALKSAYEKYFAERDKEIRGEIDKMDIVEIRKIILPNLIFFDEALVSMLSSSFDFEEVEEPERYLEFLASYAQDNMLYFIEKILKP